MTAKILLICIALTGLFAFPTCAAASSKTAKLAVVHIVRNEMARPHVQFPSSWLHGMGMANAPVRKEPEPEVFTVKAGDKIKDGLIEIVAVSDNAVTIKMQREFCDITTSRGKQGKEFTVEQGMRPLELAMVGVSDASIRYTFWLVDE